MTTRYQWQCRGFKVLFSSQKSAKIHVSFHIRAEAAPAARAAAARAEDSDPLPPAGLGRRRGRGSVTAGYRRPGRHTGPANSDGPPTRASRSAAGGPDPGGPRQNHWQQGLRDSARSGSEPLYQMVILDPQCGSARIVSLAVIAPGVAARDHDFDSDAGGGLGPELSSDSDSGLGLTASDWQDDDQENDCPDSVRGEPGEQYLVKYYQ